MKIDKITENDITYEVITDMRSGVIYWYLNGKMHREHGPARIQPDGYQEWRLNGQLHRADGPAILYVDGSQDWWYQDQYLAVTTQVEFEQWLHLKAFE